MKTKLRIIVTGLIAQHPALGGVTWFYLQYALGLARLGHDVYYIEDSGEWPYRFMRGGSSNDRIARDPTANITHLAEIMARFGLQNKWAYRFPLESRWYGLSPAEQKALLASADLLINVSGTLERPENYRRVKRLAYLDTDPVFTQLRLARGQSDLHILIDTHDMHLRNQQIRGECPLCFRAQVDAHDVHFSFGECLSDVVPATGHRWRPTRTLVVLSEWHPATPHHDAFTTIMNWTSYNGEMYGGQRYGQKDVEFERFLDLPRMVAPTVLELAIGMGKGAQTPYELLTRKGWRLVDPLQVCPDVDSLRSYTESSKAEWSVAKNGYVVGRSGWFSERSARYLAAGRPVVVQDTGFSSVLPVGEGILPFNSMEEAIRK
jgi:hypothetical protein